MKWNKKKSTNFDINIYYYTVIFVFIFECNLKGSAVN